MTYSGTGDITPLDVDCNPLQDPLPGKRIPGREDFLASALLTESSRKSEFQPQLQKIVKGCSVHKKVILKNGDNETVHTLSDDGDITGFSQLVITTLCRIHALEIQKEMENGLPVYVVRRESRRAEDAA